jgi:hypothetical protein
LSIQLLDPIEWPKLDDIFRDEWNANLPDPNHGNIIAEMDEDELIGFCMTESLVRVGNFYTVPKHRGNGTTLRLIRKVQQSARNSQRSFIALADEQRYERLFQRLHMRRAGMAYRKDF